MKPTIVHSGISRMTGYAYFVDDDGDVARVRDSELRGQKTARVEKLRKLGLPRAPDRFYFVDDKGNVRAASENRGGLLFANLVPLEVSHSSASYFEPSENGSWILFPGKASGSWRVGSGRVVQYGTSARDEAWLPGDRIFLWDDAAGRPAVAIGELTSIWPEGKQSLLNVAWMSELLSPADALADELRNLIARPASAASRRAGDDRLVRVPEEAARRAATLLEPLHPAIRTQWPDAFGADVAARPDAVPLYETCY
jgi:hypothetical protein